MSKPKFAANSRYLNTEISTVTLANGNQINFLKRRFISDPSKFSAVGFHLVEEGDRPDLIAHNVYSDSELFWQIADANAVIHPFELTERIQTRIRLALPEGVEALEELDA
jgi:hypothetical protein